MTSVRLTNCFENFCAGSNEPITGFALIRLVNQHDGLLLNSATNTYAPGKVLRANIDPLTGCYTTCPLACNNELSPSGSYYEIQEFINGKCCGSHIVQLDCENNVYPDPTPVSDVSLVNPGPAGNTAICNIVQSCETPWVGVNGLGIQILPGNNPSGGAGNGHKPTVAVRLSTDLNNDLSFGVDGGLYMRGFDCTDLAACSINSLGDVDTVTVAPTTGTVLIWNGTNWVPGDNVTHVTVHDTNTVDLTIVGSGSLADPFDISGIVKIDPAADNALLATPDGLYVSCDAINACVDVCGTLETCALVNIGDVTYSSTPTAADVLYFNGTDWTNLNICSAIGSCNLEALANVACSAPSVGDVLIWNGTDWTCQSVPATTLGVTDTQCIDLTLVGTGLPVDPYMLSASPVIAPVASNLLSCTVSGMLVEASMQAGAGNCIDLSVTGSGSTIDPWVVNAGVVLNTCDPDNMLTCTPCGLRAIGSLITVGTDCVISSVVGAGTETNPWVITTGLDVADNSGIACTAAGLSVVIDPNAANSLTVGPAGLFVPAVDPFACSDLNTCSLNDLGDVIEPAPTAGDVLYWNGTSWTGENACTIIGSCGLNSLADVVCAAPATGDVLKWNGTTWTCSPDNGSVVTSSNTPCLNLSVSGTGSPSSPYVVTGTVVGGDSIACTPDGLEVVRSTDAGNIFTFGSDGGAYVPAPVIPVPEPTFLNVVDNACLDLTIVGNGTSASPYVISGAIVMDDSITCNGDGLAVNVSNDLGNIISFSPVDGGIYAAAPAPVIPDGSETKIQVVDTTCLDLTISGLGSTASPYVITGDVIGGDSVICTPDGLEVKVSSLLGNVITFGPDGGIFAPAPAIPVYDGSETKITALDTPCVETVITGSGTTANPYVVSTGLVLGDSIVCSGGLEVAFSADTGNIATFGSDGKIFVPHAELQVVDSPCFDFQLVGDGCTPGEPWVLTGSPITGDSIECTMGGLEVVLSSDPNNIITFGTDGALFVPDWTCDKLAACSIADLADVVCASPNIGDILTWNGTDWVCAPVAGDGTMVDNTSCIALTMTGTTITASPILDPDPNNILQCRAGGLFVSPADGTETDLIAGDCITVTGNGAAVTPYNISVNVSSTAGNIISCTPDGLYVPAPTGAETILQIVDTTCINLSLTGVGTTASPYVLSAVPVLDPNSDNIITCTANGLYVKDIVVASGDGIVVTGTGTQLDPYRPNLNLHTDTCLDGAGTLADPLTITLSPDPLNSLVCTPAGLFAKEFQCEDLNTCSIDDLGDVIEAAPVLGDVLWYDGTNWTGDNLCSLLDNCSINALADVVCLSPSVGDVLTWNGTDWSCGSSGSVCTQIATTPVYVGELPPSFTLLGSDGVNCSRFIGSMVFAGNTGFPQTVQLGGTLNVVGTGIVTVNAQAVDTLEISIDSSASTCPSDVLMSDGAGGVVWATPTVVRTAITTVTANYAATAADNLILVDASAGDVTVTLPACSPCGSNTFTVKKIDSSTNVVTVVAATGQIDAAASAVIDCPMVSATFACDGTNYWAF